MSDILGWNMGVPAGYGVAHSYKKDDIQPSLADPLDHTSSSILNRGLPPLYRREFETKGSYVDVDQRLAHALELHHLEAKGGWCRLNHLGETVVVLRVDPSGGFVCTLDREAMDVFLATTDTSFVRVVDVTTTSVGHDGARAVLGPEYRHPKNEVFLRTWMLGGRLFGVRGFDIIRLTPKRRARAHLIMRGQVPREYATFKILDFKHGKTVEWEANPEKVGNYFVASELPFGTSPVFFKPDVLTQYRTDPARFRVLPDRVQCVGTWSIPYYLNDEGQVHVYLVDLARLPYEEQLGWKRWNEEEKGPISGRAYTQDFLGQWTTDHDPLESLGDILTSFPVADSASGCTPVWALGKLPLTRNLDFLGYVVTESQKEFEDQVLALAQIVVEGLRRGDINSLADSLGCRDMQLGSIKQLARVMESLGVAEDARDTIISPLVEIQNRRSSSVAHRGTGTVDGDQRVYFRELLDRSDKSIRKLAELVVAGVFKPPPPKPSEKRVVRIIIEEMKTTKKSTRKTAKKAGTKKAKGNAAKKTTTKKKTATKTKR